MSEGDRRKVQYKMSIRYSFGRRISGAFDKMKKLRRVAFPRTELQRAKLEETGERNNRSEKS